MLNIIDYEDAKQEAYLKMLLAKAHGKEISNERAFLKACERNYIRDLIKKKKLVELTGEIVSRNHEAVSLVLDKMKGRFPLLLHMRYFEGLPARKIAERLGKNVKYIHSDLTRAKRKFERIYNET
jgi:RNA polymerase sigma factor (sigma-70 family)